jgi:hypothetical protein
MVADPPPMNRVVKEAAKRIMSRDAEAERAGRPSEGSARPLDKRGELEEVAGLDRIGARWYRLSGLN